MTQTAPAHAWPLRASLADWLTIAAIWFLLAGCATYEILHQTELVSLGFYALHCNDFAPVLAVAAIVANLLANRPGWHAYTLPILLIALLFFANLMRGAMIEPQPAMLWARANAATALILLLAVTMRATPNVMQGLRTGLLTLAGVLTALFLLRLVVSPTLFMTPQALLDREIDGSRPFSAQGALALVFASMMVTSEVLYRRTLIADGKLLAALGLPVLILLSGQGTATIAEVAGLCVIAAMQRGTSRPIRIGAGLALLPIALAFLPSVLPSFMNSDEFLRRSGNLDTRQAIWESLMAIWPFQPFDVQAFGFPAGQQPVLTIQVGRITSTWEYSIHSMYFGSLATFGYIGAAAYILVLATTGWQLLAATEKRGIPAFALACWLVTAIFSYSYEIRDSELIGLVAAIWWLRAIAEVSWLALPPRAAES